MGETTQMEQIQEGLCISRELSSLVYAPICAKYQLTQAEIMILLYLSRHSARNTARDIVETLRIAKSHISVSVRCLEERGYLTCSHEGHDRRTVRLHLLDAAREIIRESATAQEKLLSVMFAGFSDDECSAMKSYFLRVTDNIRTYLDNDKHCTRTPSA